MSPRVLMAVACDKGIDEIRAGRDFQEVVEAMVGQPSVVAAARVSRWRQHGMAGTKDVEAQLLKFVIAQDVPCIMDIAMLALIARTIRLELTWGNYSGKV